ncbi:hypothetical protein CQW23_30865 [Capsicum baccatum]|uniref:AN1-type domain-containing protein n=1 Tax=Capsicum baccatum TaxID=33114 RepID=A0A2G2V9F1_CAPBA|nr:hypothetical protein CQW23_30865 [Capsicum baccatum]
MHGKYKAMSCFCRASTVTGASLPQYDLRRDTCGVELDLLTAEMESSKETGCRAPEDPILCINDCDFLGAAVASADLASQISQVKLKEGLKKCSSCHKLMGLTRFSCKCGDLFCPIHHYSNKHNCLFDYRNAGQNAIAKVILLS